MSLSWRGASVAPTDEMPSPEAWEPVTVPGRPAQFAGADAVAYETVFDDPRSGAAEHAVLVLTGVYGQARVWCNGERVAGSDHYVTPLRVMLPDAEDHRVVVACRRPEHRFGGLHDTDRLPPERCVPGIWWGARIETYADPAVDRLWARPTLTEGGGAVDVRAEVVTSEPLDDRLTFSLRPAGAVRGGGMMDRVRVETDPGRTTVSTTIDVRDPSLWWPHDRGDQSRYVVRAKIGGTEHSLTTGLHSVTHDGTLRINGERVSARGVTLLDPTVADVERAVDANANLVRIRAQGVSPAVAEACDEHGVLLWADLPLTGPGEFDVDRGRELAASMASEIGHHPSLACVTVHDEPVDPYADGLGSGLLDRLRFRLRARRASYDDTTARTVADEIEGVPTFPVVGPPGIDPDAVTLYPGWQYGSVDDLAWLCDTYDVGGAVAGFGAGSAGSQATQARIVQALSGALRRRESDIVVLDCLRDVPAGDMGVLTTEGAEKRAYRTLSDSYQPTQVFLADPTPGESDIVVCHDRSSGATVTVEWDHNGDRKQEERVIGAFGRVRVGSLTLDAGDELTLAAAVEGHAVKNEYRIDGSI